MHRLYCDACGTEMNNISIRPKVNVTVYGVDGTPMVLVEFCDACYMTFWSWLRDFVTTQTLRGPSGTLRDPHAAGH